MKICRIAAALAIVALATHTLYSLVYQPARCNVVKRRAEAVTLEIFERQGSPVAAAIARRAISNIQPCLAVSPTDVDLYMIVALDDRVLGRLSHAADMYRQALEYDRRPEVYFNLGAVQLEMKQPDAALASFVMAGSFAIEFADDVPDPALREAIINAVRRQQQRIRTGTRSD